MSFRVLIVEDIETKRLSMTQLVESVLSPVEVHCSASVKSAIQRLDQHSYSLILLDMSLPTFDLSKSEGGGTPRPRLCSRVNQG